MVEIEKLSLFGNSNIGIYLFTNDDLTLVPPGLREKEISIISKVLKTRIIEARVAGSFLLGIFVAGNNHAIILPRIVREMEVEKIKREVDVPVYVVNSLPTAMGNVILTNDNYAYLHPDMAPTKDIVSKALGVPAETKYVANLPTVGSAAVVTNKGGIVHPEAKEDEIIEMSEKFRVPVSISTVNFGVPFVKVGVVANVHGVLVGEETSGPEMARIEQALAGKLGK